MVLCSSTHQSLMFLAGTEATLMVSRIPHTFIFCVVQYNLKNSQLISFNKLFCYEKYANLDAAVGFPTKINHSGIKEPEHLIPQGFAKREYICAAAVYMNVFLIH